MDIKESVAAKDRYREAQVELKSNYDRDVKNIKDNFDGKIEKQSKNYSEHKNKLEEENQINNEFYTEKTKSAINRGQEEFKTKIKENTSRFEKEKNSSKADFSEKLTDLSTAYKKSFDENNRYHDQVKQSLGDKYTTASKRSDAEFNSKISGMSEKMRTENAKSRESERADRISLMTKNSEELDNLRLNATDSKYKEVARLKQDNENLRTTLGRDNQMLKDRQEERVADLMKLKGKENEDGMKNFENLQQNIRQKNISEQEKMNASHSAEAKTLEKKFNDDVRNINNIANEKIKGGTSADTLVDELKQTKTSYENRLAAAHEEINRSNQVSAEKEKTTDLMFRDKIKEMKTSQIENISKKEAEANETLNKTVYENRENFNSLSERFKADASLVKKETDAKFAQTNGDSKNKIKEQRVEFGRVVNSMNDKNMETINSLKDDLTKDKSVTIEKTKKAFSEEKIAMKDSYNRQATIRDSLYEQKLADLEKQTSKIIDNYENRISQIARKAEAEVTSVKTREETRKLKEGQANAFAFDTLRQEQQNDIAQMRDKYEGTIQRNTALSEQKTGSLVQKYEDTILRERNDHQKELAVRLGEAQTQFETLYKSSELEKATLRNQYEQRIENMKLASSANERSKKA
jgi:hypothetical protein